MASGNAQRRRRIALGVMAVLAAVAGAAVGAHDDERDSALERGFCDGPVARAAGQRVMVRMEGRATRELRRAARAGAIGGVILFPPPGVAAERLGAQLTRLQRAATAGGNPLLLVAIDQEGGVVKRLPALPPTLSPPVLAERDDPAAAELEGGATGAQLGELGVNVNLAPVLDVPASAAQFMAPRAFGSTPQQVRRLGLAFAAGQRREGVAATAKHFPGLGRAAENTDLAPTVIGAARGALGRDLASFRAAIESGIDLVMVASAAYPALGTRAPAVLAPGIVTGVLRGELGFAGVVVSDDLLAPAIASSHAADEAATLAAGAGVDLLLFARDDAPGIAAALVAAIRRGALDEAQLRASCARVEGLKERLAAGGPL